MFKHIIAKNIGNLISNKILKDILSSINEKQILYSYIIFSKYYLSYININDEKEVNYLYYLGNWSNLNKNIIILWYLFLFNEIGKKKINLEKGDNKYIHMNQIMCLLEETNRILFKLYLTGKFNEDDIFHFIDFYLFWIEYYSQFYFINEKNRKIKNFYFFKYLFSLLDKIIPKIMKNLNKEKLDLLIKFMENLKKSDEINNEYNIILLIKQNYIQSFIQNILYNIDSKKIKQINKNFYDILISFYSHFLKFKFRLSNIFDIFLDNLRIAYEHLYNFEDNIEKIINDLSIQNFQTKLFQKINQSEEAIINKNESPLMNESFLFNGLDSIISFKIGDFNYVQSAFFFSFNFNPNISKNNNNIIYPIIIIQREIPKDSKNFIYENIFLLYIEKTNKREKGSELYSLCISQPLMKANSSNKEENIIIRKNINYYCCIYFEEKHIKIYLYNDYNKDNNNIKIKKKTIKLSNIPKKNIVLSLGCDSLVYNQDKKDKDEKKNFFSGFIGPLFIIRDLISKISRHSTLEEIIEKILLLKGGYKDLFYFKNRVKTINNNIINNYNKDNIDYSFNKESNENEKIINSLLKKHYENFDCLLYLVPNCFIYYNNKNDLNKRYHLPLVSNFCNKHKNYIIKKINITLSKCNLSIPNFIYDNGFNYFCLQIEYFNQLVQYYLANKKIKKENFNDIFANNDKNSNDSLINDIIYSIKEIILFMGTRGNEINLSKIYKQIFMTLFNLLKNLNQIKPIINDIIKELISLSDIYKGNIFINYYNLRNILNLEQNAINEIEKEKEKEKEKNKIKIIDRLKLLQEEKAQIAKGNYKLLINKNCSFFVGIIEILLSKEFYMNNNSKSENYSLMKLAFEKVSSIMDIKDYDCLSYFSYQNLFIQALSFTNLLKELMFDYMPDIKIANNKIKNNNNFYINYG